MAVLAFLSRGRRSRIWDFLQVHKKSDPTNTQSAKQANRIHRNSMYNHGFATLALAEYYGLTNDSSIGPALKKATNLIVSAQKTNPKRCMEI